MSAFMFMWRASDHTMKEAVECSSVDYKASNIIEMGFADCLDLVEAAYTAADCLGRDGELGVGITYNNYFLEINEDVKNKFEKIEFLCPTELFKQKENFALLRPHIYDRDRAMTISVVTWNTELYTLEEALKEGVVHRMNNPVNGSSNVVMSDITDAIVTGASAFSANPIGIAIEHGDRYLDLSLEAGLEILLLAEFDDVEYAFDMVEMGPYLKEII